MTPIQGDGQTLLVAVAHPDDEVLAAGSILAQVAKGDRVVILWLTRGEMTQAFGDISTDVVAARREAHGAEVAAILGAEHRFMDFEDTRLAATPDAIHAVASVIAEVCPDGVVTWGNAWARGNRHPDHEACGSIVRHAVTLARIQKVVSPLTPHREWCPVFTIRNEPALLPAVVVDVEPYLERVLEIGRFYRETVGYGDPTWLEQKLRDVGESHGIGPAEAFDAWESAGGNVEALLPATPGGVKLHPVRDEGEG